eukprot:923476-Amphidinium_carterae.1
MTQNIGAKGSPKGKALSREPQEQRQDALPVWWGTSWLWAKSVVDNTELPRSVQNSPNARLEAAKDSARKEVVGQSEAGSQREQDRDKRAAPICFA